MTEKDPRVVADYVLSMCADLAVMAEDAGFDMGAYLLRMACYELQTQSLELGGRVAAKKSAG